MLVGVLSVGSEYVWGTFHLVFRAGPGRLHWLAARLVALTALTLGMTAAVLGAAAASSLSIAMLEGRGLTLAGARHRALGPWHRLAGPDGLRRPGGDPGPAAPPVRGPDRGRPRLPAAVEDLVLWLLGPLGGDALAAVVRVMPARNADALVQVLEGIAAAHAPAPPVGAGQATAVLLLEGVALAAVAALLVRRRDLA